MARVWDIPSRRLIFENREHSETQIYAIALSTDGKLLATGGGDATTRLWKIDSADLLKTFAYAGKWVRGVQFSPDGRILAVGGTGDNTLQLWDVESLTLRVTLAGSTSDFLTVLFSADGKTLAAGTRDGFVRVWDAASGELRQSYSGHQRLVWAVGSSPDGRFLASAGEDRTLRFWDSGTGQEIASVDCEFEISALVFSLDHSTTSVFCTAGDTTRRYDLNQLGPPSVLSTNIDSDINSLAIAPNGETIATVDTIGTLILWDVATAKPRRVISNPQHSFHSVDFAPDGKSIVIAGGSKEQGPVVQYRDTITGETISTLTGHAKYVTTATFSPDGKTLATGSEDRQIKLWDVETNQERLTMKGSNHSIRGVSFSPDGNRLISVGLDDRARVWDVRTGNQLFDIESYVTARFSPDGRLIAAGGSKHVVKLWDAFTGREIETLKGHSGNLRAIAFSPDGKRLASAGEDQTIRLWDLETGLELVALKGHTNRVTLLAFSPNGRLLVSSSKDKTIRLWRAATGEEIRVANRK